jgi:hypothetical protein
MGATGVALRGRVAEKIIRNLAHLQDSASSSRVLNLLRVHNRASDEAEHRLSPFFNDQILNRAIILKHRLRRDEADLFFDGRTIATKVIIPIDCGDLRLGGRSVLVNQLNYDQIMEGMFGDPWMEGGDRQMLEILDGIPSLDPFLLREHLRRFDRNPARCYFDISEADMAGMFGFVEREVQRLIDLCYVNEPATANLKNDRSHSSRLVKKILSNAVDAETEPLRLTLRLERRDYQEGVFCWKGFLYYKWTLADAMPGVTRVADAIAAARAHGTTNAETRTYLEKSRRGLGRAILQICEGAKASLKVYDTAFARLVGGEPTAFREFLLNAPGMFTELGERLGAVNHIVSFWNFRFPSGQLPKVTPEELFDIFTDFDNSLSFANPHRARNAA